MPGKFDLYRYLDHATDQDDPKSNEPCPGAERCRCDQFSGTDNGRGKDKTGAEISELLQKSARRILNTRAGEDIRVVGRFRVQGVGFYMFPENDFFGPDLPAERAREVFDI